MKTTQIVAFAASLLLINASQVWGQFDLGNVFRNEIRRGAQQIQGEIRGAVRGASQEWRHSGPQHQILPYPPQPSLQPIVRPQPILRPQPWRPEIGRPVETIICPTPQIPTRTITHRSEPQSKPLPPAGRQPQPEAESGPLPRVMGGQEVAIDGEGFGNQTGSVRIKIGQMILIAQTVSWSDTTVDAIIPQLPLVETTEAMIAVINSEKQVVQQLAVLLAPAPEGRSTNNDSTSAQGAASEPQLPVVQMGSELDLAGTQLGDKRGSVLLTIGDSKMNASIVSWGDSEVTIRLPKLALADATPGSIQLKLADGQSVSDIPVLFRK